MPTIPATDHLDDMTRNQTLPRNGGAPRRLMARRRRPVLPALVALTALITVPAALGAETPEETFTGVRLTSAGLQGPTGEPIVVTGVTSEQFTTPPPLATVAGLTLLVPAHEVVMLGYHEASYGDALDLVPVGELVANENTTKFVAPEDVASGAAYQVLSSRGRPHGAATAVDVVMGPDVDVISPVTGVVTDVRPYLLYGRYEDTRIEIQPDDAPDLRVVMIHVKGVGIQVGDVVVGGQTVLAEQANLFGFSSQIDRYTEPNRFGHVHIEVKPPGSHGTD